MPVKVCERCVGMSCVTRVPIFSSLNNEQRTELLLLVERKTLKKGEVFIHEQSELSVLAIVNRGKLKAYTNGINGKQSILYLFNMGDFFGEHSLFVPHPIRYSVEALEDSGVCMIRSEEFQVFLQSHPDTTFSIIRELANRLDMLEGNLTQLNAISVDERLSELLDEFAKRYGTQTEEGVLLRLPLTQEEIGNRLGLTRETISRKLSQFQRDGKIRVIKGRTILILR